MLIPRGSTKTDWEVELGSRDRRTARYLDERRATPLACIAGYVISQRRVGARVPARARRPVGQGQELRDVQPARAVARHRRRGGRPPGARPAAAGSTASCGRTARPPTWSSAVAPHGLVPSASSWCCDPGDLINTGTPAGVALGMTRRRRTCAPATSSSSRSTASAAPQTVVRPGREAERMTEFDGLVAIVTGGASGIGLATAPRSPTAARRVAVLDLAIDGLPDDRLHGFVADVADRASVDARGRGRRGAVRRHRHRGQQRGHRAPSAPSRTTTTPSGRACSTSTCRAWRGSARPRCRGCARRPPPRSSTSARSPRSTGSRERALYSASKGAVLALTFAMATDHVARGHPGELRQPGNRLTPWVERLLAGLDDPAAERAALEARQADGAAGDARGGRRRRSLTSPARCRARPPAPRSRSTAASTTSGCAR